MLLLSDLAVQYNIKVTCCHASHMMRCQSRHKQLVFNDFWKRDLSREVNSNSVILRQKSTKMHLVNVIRKGGPPPKLFFSFAFDYTKINNSHITKQVILSKKRVV